MTITRDTFYRVACGGSSLLFPLDVPRRILKDAAPCAVHLRARWTGEKRMVKKGEWYLSGAIIEAHLAYNDLEFEHHIARLVRIKIVEVLDKEYPT